MITKSTNFYSARPSLGDLRKKARAQALVFCKNTAFILTYFRVFFYIMRNVVNKKKRKHVIIKCRHLIAYKKAKHFSHSLVLLDILLISGGFSVSR